MNATFTAEQVTALRETAEGQGKTAVLGLRFESGTSGVVEDKGTLIYVLDITLPILYFEPVSNNNHYYNNWAWWEDWWYRVVDYNTPYLSCWSGSGLRMKVRMPDGLDNLWTIRCKLEYDPSTVDTYNNYTLKKEDVANGDGTSKTMWWKEKTWYESLPDADDIAFFDLSGNRITEAVMEPGVNEVEFIYKRNTSSFNGAGLYLCPVVVSTDLDFPVSFIREHWIHWDQNTTDAKNYYEYHGIDPETERTTFDDEPYYVLFQDEITLNDKTLWEPVPAQQGSLANLYDGQSDGSHLWHTPWDNGNYIDETYGQYFQINIPSYQPSHGLHIGVWARSDNWWTGWGNEKCSPRHMKVFITSDSVPAPTGDYAADRATYDALNWVEVADLNCTVTGGMMWQSPAISLGGRVANAVRICTMTKGDHLGNIWSCTGPNADGTGQFVAIGDFKMWGN